MFRRPSLVSIPDDSHAESWESFKDDGETELPQDGHEMSREFVIELPPMEDEIKPKSKRRRRPHSYQMLEKRLTCEAQYDIIKSFNLKEMTASINPATLPTASSPSRMEPKALDLDVANTFQSKSEQPLASRQQCARGA